MTFTRTELIVVVICLLLISFITGPFVLRRRLHGQIQQVVNNGRSIYMANLPNDYVEWIDNGKYYRERQEMVFPSERQGIAYGTSTRYFRWMVSTWSRPYYNLFAAPGLRIYRGTNAVEFTEENNAWCVALDISPPMTSNIQPLYFTRNLEIRKRTGKIASLSDEVPFGKKGVVVIMSDGSGVAHNEATVLSIFNSSFSNCVMRP